MAKDQIETRPYENEHACRLRDPGDFQEDSFVRTTRKHEGKQYSVIQAKLKGEDSLTDQAFRYKKTTWTVSQARSHCKDHEGSFEAAKDSKDGFPRKKLERRILSPDATEVRVEEDEQPKIIGYAAKYGVIADLGWFREKIKPGALDEALKIADVRCLKNHDPNLILGRTSSGTLRLKSNTVGLRFEDDVPDTNTGRDTLEEVRRKDITGCSFSFTVAEEDWKYQKDQPPERTILKIGQLFDVGPVTYPAYTDTSVAARSLEAFKERSGELIPENVSIEPPAEPVETIDKTRERQIRKGYRKAERIINRCRPSDDGTATGRADVPSDT